MQERNNLQRPAQTFRESWKQGRMDAGGRGATNEILKPSNETETKLTSGGQTDTGAHRGAGARAGRYPWWGCTPWRGCLEATGSAILLHARRVKGAKK